MPARSFYALTGKVHRLFQLLSQSYSSTLMCMDGLDAGMDQSMDVEIELSFFPEDPALVPRKTDKTFCLKESQRSIWNKDPNLWACITLSARFLE